MAQAWISKGLRPPTWDGVVQAHTERTGPFGMSNIWTCQRCKWSGVDKQLAELIQWAEEVGQREVTFGQRPPWGPDYTPTARPGYRTSREW
jgi:hypothetical protein